MSQSLMYHIPPIGTVLSCWSCPLKALENHFFCITKITGEKYASKNYSFTNYAYEKNYSYKNYGFKNYDNKFMLIEMSKHFHR